MSTCYRQLGLNTLCCTILLGCSSPLDPDALPYRLDVVQELPADAYPGDLDGNGRDELIRVYTPHQQREGIEAIWITTQDDQTIEQVNYVGTIAHIHFLYVLSRLAKEHYA